MLPRWHILWGLVFTLTIWLLFQGFPWIYLSLVFLSSFLIDFDHYLSSVIKTKKLSLFHSLEYHKLKGFEQEKEKKQGIKRKSDFHIFHTIEFHIVVMILSFFWIGFLFIFIGMAFHSTLDFVYLVKRGYVYRREYFLSNWLYRKLK